MKSSNLACCWRKLAPAGFVVSIFRVRCIRSWRPFCCGQPGLMRSISIPSLSHQTESFGTGEGNTIVSTDGLGQAELVENGLKYAESVGFLGGGERFAGEQVATGKIGDRQRIAIAPIGKHELALVVGAPKVIGLT